MMFCLQLRGAQILDAVRLHKNGFPECLSFGEFWRRYRILSEENQTKNPSHQEMKSAVEDLLTEMDLDKSAFRLGNSQVSWKLCIWRSFQFLMCTHLSEKISSHSSTWSSI